MPGLVRVRAHRAEMAPKKSKKQKQKEAQLELERIAEEERLASIKAAEEAEKRRIQQEEEERLRKEEEARLQAELDERLLREDKENEPIYAESKEALNKQVKAYLYDAEWSRYIECSPLPEVSSEASVNTFLTEWREEALDELDATVDACELAHELEAELGVEAAVALERGATAQATWQRQLQEEVRSCRISKLDHASADFLQRADEYANAKNEVMLQVAQRRCKFGLWVNLAKNPRIKSIEFGVLSISTELPKSLALASVAIRAMHFTSDSLSPRDPPPAALEAKGGPYYQTVGGVLTLELLTLPPAVKKLKGWTMRQITDMCHSLHKQPYPLPSEAGAVVSSAAAPPLRITYQIPKHVVMPDKGQVGYFNPDDQLWRTDGVSEFTFDAETRVASFLSARLTSLALLQPTHIEMPYKKWLITPNGPSACTLHLVAQLRTYTFEVGTAGVTLTAPKLPELEHVLGRPLSAPRLLALLRESGLNLCPTDNDMAQLAQQPGGKDTLKEAALEEEMHRLITPILPALQVAYSRWNQTRGAAKILCRISPKGHTFDIDAELGEAPAKEKDPFDEVEGNWQTMSFANRSAEDRNVALIKALDSDQVCDMGVSEGMEAHSTPFLCCKPVYEDVAQEAALSSQLFQENVRVLLNKLRIFSFTQFAKEKKK